MRELVRFDALRGLGVRVSSRKSTLGKRAHTSRRHISPTKSSLPERTSPHSSGARQRACSPAALAARRPLHCGVRPARGTAADYRGASFRRRPPHAQGAAPHTWERLRQPRSARRRDVGLASRGCRRADADPGQPHAAAARRGKQQAGGRRRKRWRPPSSRSAPRRRPRRASSRSASGLMQKKQNNRENDGARPS